MISNLKLPLRVLKNVDITPIFSYDGIFFMTFFKNAVVFYRFNIDIKIDPSSIEIKEKEEVRVSKDFLVTLTIVHKHTGSHRLCLNLTSENHR